MNGKTFAVDHLIKLTESRLVLVGNLAMIPLTVTYTYDGKNYVIEHTYGQTRMITTIDADAKFPHVDNLDNNTIALEFESNYQLKAAVATWNGEGRDAYMSFTKAFVANADGVYAYHGVAGMNSNKFIIAATGERNNGTGPIHEPHPIRCKVATVNNGEITFGDWELRWFSDSINWFALDNFNQHEALITYYDETEGNGIVAMAIFLDGPEATKVRYGGYTIIEHGGAAVSYQKITMRILSHSRFGVFFPDASNNGNLVFMMGERSSNNEITRAGANFVVARKSRKQQGGLFYFSIAAIDYKRFTLLDYFVSNSRKYSSLSIGYHMAYPIGITTSRDSKAKYIQFNGVYTFTDAKTKLVPGYTYYTNSNGGIIMGRPYGYNHAEFGSFYVDAWRDSQLCALHNQIGIAVSEKELLIRTY